MTHLMDVTGDEDFDSIFDSNSTRILTRTWYDSTVTELTWLRYRELCHHDLDSHGFLDCFAVSALG